MATANQASRSEQGGPDRATLRRAIKGLHRVLLREPGDLRSIVRMARAHRVLGEYERSARWYKVAIGELSSRGKGLRALGLAKELLTVAPEDHELLLDMARLVAKSPGDHVGRVAIPLDDDGRTVIGRIPREFTATSARALQVLDDPFEVERLQATGTTRAKTGSTRPKTPPPPPAAAFMVEDEDILGEAEERVGIEDGKGLRAVTLQRARLGEMPLLSSLGKGAAVALMQQMSRIDLVDGAVLFDEGRPARSFFIIAEGRLEGVSRRSGEPRVLFELEEAEVAGVFGLYSGRRRQTTMRAKGPAVVFEITDRTLAQLVREHPAAKKALARFYRRRLLETFLATTPVFQDLPRSVRLEIVEKFRQRVQPARSNLVAPGEVVNGIWLVMKGEVQICTREGGRSLERARVGRGQVFGCLAALGGEPTRSTAECLESTAVAALSHRALADVMAAHPEVRSLHRRLAEGGAIVAPSIFVGQPLTHQ